MEVFKKSFSYARRRWRIVIAVLILGIVSYLGLRVREPSAGGKTLSQWLHHNERDFVWIPNDVYGHIHDELWAQLIHSTPDFERDQFMTNRWPESSAAAVRQMGPRAIPWLSRWMEEHDTELDHWIANSRLRLPKALQSPVPATYGFGWGSRACRWRVAAFEGFAILGTNALPALPRLRAQLESGIDLPLTWAIANVGPEGIKVLADALERPSSSHKANIVTALGLQGAAAKSALPSLIACIERVETDYDVLGAIGRIDPRAPELGSVLIRLLGRPNPHFDPDMVLLLLGLRGEASAPALPTLERMYLQARSAADASQCRLLRRVIRRISWTAEAMLPSATADEQSDDWP